MRFRPSKIAIFFRGPAVPGPPLSCRGAPPLPPPSPLSVGIYSGKTGKLLRGVGRFDGVVHSAALRGDGKLLVGYAGISRLGRKPPFEYEVHTIGVDPAYQGQGIGRQLLRGLFDFAGDATIFLEVRTDNAAAIALYESEGFEQVGLRKRYYRVSGADAYTMKRDGR